ncbi:MAG: phosphate ABC transporter substrate-binding protein PstS [Actinobacteria bacterium]|nr:phosphate ABC transporter substrate-binding protein PstS [Actinomycetota bacterium]
MQNIPRKSRSQLRRFGVGIVLAGLVVTAGACGSSGSTKTSDSKNAASTTAASGSSNAFDPAKFKDITATLKGSGSTFQQNYNLGAINVLEKALPNLKISYGGGGSGQGKSDLADGVVDFAGSDSLIKPENLSKYKSTVLYFPTVVAPITVSYDLDGVTGLKLDGPALAKIFSGKVTTWNDASIKALNPSAKLPADPITVCHRADASGTTTNFSKFLVAAGGTDWTLGSSDTIDWPTGTQGAQGNGGVAACIAKKSGAIGYVDFADAKAQKLTFASIKNASGSFVEASLKGASAAAAAAAVKDDLTYDPINATGADVYPITSPTWVLVSSTQKDANVAKGLGAFLTFLLTDGQDSSFTDSLDYAPIPKALATKALAQVDKIKAS